MMVSLFFFFFLSEILFQTSHLSLCNKTSSCTERSLIRLSSSPQAILTALWTSLGPTLSWWAAIQNRTTTTAAQPCNAAPLAPPHLLFPPWTKAAANVGSLAAPAARVSTATRTPTSGTRGAFTRLLAVRSPSSGPLARGRDVKSSQSWTRSWRKPPAPCCTSPVYAAARRAPNALSRAQNLAGNEFSFTPIRPWTQWNPNLWPPVSQCASFS